MVTTSLLVSAGSWLIRRWGAVVGTTKYSEQSHVPNHDSKEKEFELKENSKIQSQDLLLLNRSQNRPSRSCWLCGLSARSPGDLPSSSLRQEWATAPSGHARALPIPNFAKNVSSWGAARHDRASSATVEHPARHLLMTCVSPNVSIYIPA